MPVFLGLFLCETGKIKIPRCHTVTEMVTPGWRRPIGMRCEIASPLLVTDEREDQLLCECEFHACSLSLSRLMARIQSTNGTSSSCSSALAQASGVKM